MCPAFIVHTIPVSPNFSERDFLQCSASALKYQEFRVNHRPDKTGKKKGG